MKRSVAIGTVFLSALAAIGGTASASPLCYTFSQTGWVGGGMVTGSFCGNDLNGDGWLVDVSNAQTGEITSYSMSFSGNINVPAFSHTLLDLFNASPGSYDGLVYKIGTQYLGDDNVSPYEGLASGPIGGILGMPGTTYSYRTGVGPTGLTAPYGLVETTITPPGGATPVSMIDQTGNWAVVTPVPVPQALAMLGGALAMLGFVRRRAQFLVR